MPQKPRRREPVSAGGNGTDAGDRRRWDTGAGDVPGGPVPGEDWGRYRVKSLLGAGGMGRVWKAWDPLLRRKVALKCLLAEDPAAVQRLLREARAQARIQHDNVCKVYEVGEVAGRPFIAMQLVAGGSLRDAAAAMSVEQRVEVMRQVAEGVHAAHRTGLIHRDLKPGNVLIDWGEDGQPHPYVVDFGVARDAAAPRETRIGLAVGSVHYMAPEQARAAAVDRRVDVWGLGATLYELLCGQPPFGDGGESEVLLQLLQGEVTPLARRAPAGASLPADLCTVVMKCLEREPARRYDSARALAADLGRYLDGEPVAARPAGLWYRAAKRLRKHRALAAVSACSLLALAVLAGVTWRTQWRARETALAAQRFGRQVQQLEATLRIAYLLPLHDVRRDQGVVRERMRQLAAQMRQLGGLARGPGHYALGRGFMALQQLPEANRELDAAWRLGNRSPEVAYALGRVLAERYQAGLEDAARLADADLRRARREEVARAFLQPARAALRRSQGAEGESRQYLLALLALADRRFPEAVRHAARAFAEDPARFEAGMLVGEVHLQLGREARERGDYPAAARWLGEGRRAYAAAAAVARSAPEVHAARCALEAAALDLELARGDSVEGSLAGVRAACGAALAADPESAAAHASLAQVYVLLGDDRGGRGADAAGAYGAAIDVAGRGLATAGPRAGDELLRLRAKAWLRLGQVWAEHGRDPRPAFGKALADAGRAVALVPGSAAAQQDLGLAQLALGEYQIGQGVDPTPALQSAAESCRRGLAIDPLVANLHHRLAYALFQRATWDSLHGRDPRPGLAAAAASYRRTLELNPRTVQAYSNLGNVYTIAAEFEVEHGLDPRPALAQAVISYRGALALQPRYAAAHQNLGAALITRGQYEAKAGLDPRPSLEQARQELEAAWALNRGNPDPASNLAAAAVTLGDYLSGRGLDPGAALAAGRRQAAASLAANPNDAEVIRTRAELDLAAARWALRQGAPAGGRLAAAARDLGRSLAINAADARTWADLAALEELRCEPGIVVVDARTRRAPAGGGAGIAAAVAGSGGAGVQAAAQRGLRAAGRALALNPRLADAERLQGALELAVARCAPDPAARHRAAAAASEALTRALALDPLLRREIEPLLAAAAALAGR
ncbi:MAG: serine/threonine protein kinase [Acidobacteria bacterium]|nr:serine/threonine protein kinase [Acidobacteriota bacterium]